MIIRIWSARTSGDPDAYEHEFRTHVLDALAGLDGFHGAYLLRRTTAGRTTAGGTEYVTLTLFDSLADVRRFAGPDVDAANVSPAARAVLDDVDERVRHFTVVSAPTPP
jgi:heme-degrading monooxygenase HmoA